MTTAVFQLLLQETQPSRMPCLRRVPRTLKKFVPGVPLLLGGFFEQLGQHRSLAEIDYSFSQFCQFCCLQCFHLARTAVPAIRCRYRA
jgi:hypothetical protein